MEPRQPEGLSTRNKILWAAATMLGEESGKLPSVRAVAARAGVSAGSVQHHFRTQRELMDEVLVLLYDSVLSDDSINDSSIPARERLVGTLQRLLVLPETQDDPYDAWTQVIARYGQAEPADALWQEFVAIEAEMRRRIEYALTVLQEEGVLEPGDNARRARFLYTVVSGLSIAQALPAAGPRAQTEIEVLRSAADYVLSERQP